MSCICVVICTKGYVMYLCVVPSQDSEMSCICVLGVSSQDSEMSCICVLGVSSQDSEMSCICVLCVCGYLYQVRTVRCHVFVC